MDLCLTGPRDMEQMDEALRTLDREPLSDEEMERVRSIVDHFRG